MYQDILTFTCRSFKLFQKAKANGDELWVIVNSDHQRL